MKMRKISLSKEQQAELANAENQITNVKLFKRIHCIKMKNEGLTHEKVGKILGVQIETIRVWIKMYCEEGLSSLLRLEYKGRAPFLNFEQQAELKNKHKEKPFQNAKEAMKYIEEKFGIKFHLHHVQKILKKNFDYHTKKQN